MVAQEAVTLSTTPVVVDGRLQPRPTSLRVFLARAADGWQVMPGGFARIGKTQDHTAIAMQEGGSVADVWVVSDRPVKAETLLPEESAPHMRPRHGSLPSRAADNLYWLGRYVERAEGTLRLLRAYHTRLAESGFPGFDAGTWYGLVGPAGLPAPMVQRMNADLNKVLALPDVAGKLAGFGAEDGGGSAARFAQFIATERAKWARVVKDANVKV